MKKYIYHALFIVACLVAIACSKNDGEEFSIPVTEFIAIPDVKFEKELVAQGIDTDGVINQKILRIDAEKVERLSLYRAEINSLEGIKGFVNLKRLYADANNLVRIDLSKNVLLDSISLSSNDLTEIEGLPMATNLKWLSLSSNLFTAFTLKNESIKHLLISHNDITTFDVSLAPKLESVLLQLNKIETLDFSKNPLLEVLVFSANNVSSIDLDLNVNLKYLYCSSNLLTEFDVSKLSKLVDLRIDRNPTLTCIKIARGQDIPTLKLSSYQQATVNCD